MAGPGTGGDLTVATYRYIRNGINMRSPTAGTAVPDCLPDIDISGSDAIEKRWSEAAAKGTLEEPTEMIIFPMQAPVAFR
jgi:hypothetical protein